MSAVVIYQIYYSEETKRLIEPEYIPYDNSLKTNKYFESQVMCDLVKNNKHLGSQYFGVVSCNLKQKIGNAQTWGRTLRNQDRQSFTPKSFEDFTLNSNADIVTMTKHPPHIVFLVAEKYHRGIMNLANDILKKISTKRVRSDYLKERGLGLNYRIPEMQPSVNQISQRPIYFNYFIARPNIYENYLNTMLIPAMDIMDNDPRIKEMCSAPSGYKEPMSQEDKEILNGLIGFPYYPMYPFICERLINIYVLAHNYTVAQW
jgi:hypothetical protein